MSLINDALKKAQNRQGDAAPLSPGAAGPAAIPSAPRKDKTPFGKVVLICAGIALLSAAVSAAVILIVLRKDEPAPPPVSPAILPAQVVQQTPATTPLSAPPATPVTTSPAVASPIAPVIETPAQPAPPTPVVSLPVPAPEPAAPAIKLGTRIQSFIDRLRVTSIRISDTGNKAILNDRLFRVNDLVEPSLGLRLTGIQPSQLTFTDESGNTYLRHF